ncbi:TATA element modulatory factor-like isoform X3 [Penaeus japonicus]|uniref:TATA element modulatory factor-like isoform X3 n=1 Tax=Penaeus japonicus TaxID=27405 RepID=UPI001C70C153|nr:TATA element modulatory factor-like isoform X3 [Penaeus japonicus]
MSWFDTAGFTSLAKSALKEAQRTIDKALDIEEENSENVVPTATVPPSGQKEKLKEESENFFASFGLDKKKSPLTPANTPVDSSAGTTPVQEFDDSDIRGPPSTQDEDGRKTSSAMVGSLWGSFTGSFFENTLIGKQQSEDTPAGTSEKDVVATQPPRSSTSLPSLKLAKSPVSTQPRTASLEEQRGVQVGNEQSEVGDSDEQKSTEDGEGSRQEWGWGWESSIMVMSAEQQQLEGEFGTTQAELEAREDSLADDNIDVEGFARSRLVVGSVDSDSGGLMRQESQGSLCGRSVDLDVPSSISEDVFDGSLDNQRSITLETGYDLGSEFSEGLRRSSISHIFKAENSDQRTTMSRGNSEVDTPDSIVVLTSDGSSPEGDSSRVSGGSTDRSKLTVTLLSEKITSPISSPESIEVLGSSSLVTSPSSIEVLSGVSSSDSSPTHQDSCSNTLTQDLSPTPTHIVSTQPTLHTSNKHAVEAPALSSALTQEKVQQESRGNDKSSIDRKDGQCKGNAEESTTTSQGQAVVKQPTHRESEESVCTSKEVASPKMPAENSPGVREVDNSSRASSSLTEDTSASESIHSTSTSSTHTVLDASLIAHDNQIPTDVGESVLPEGGSQLSAPEGNINAAEETTKGDSEALVEERKGVIAAAVVASTADVGSEVMEGNISGVSLDMSVESGGSSDTITASVDSTQMLWSSRSHIGGGEQDQIDGSVTQDSGMTGSGGSVVRCLLEEAMGDEEATSGASSPPEREHSPSSSERSEALKVGSGHTSGHSSGDEIETTTSSDIEVISSPSLDGSTVARGSAAASRVWASAQRGLRSFLNDRSESPASDSSSNNKKNNTEKAETVPSSMTTSFTSISESEGETYTPLVLGDLNSLDHSRISQVLHDLQHFEKGHRRNQSNLSETSESSSEPHSPEVEKLLKKISQLSEILEARETKLMELSQVNAALQDTNLRLKSNIEELEGGCATDATESLREEYTQRLVTMERKFQQALREKEAIKKQLEEVRAEAATRLSSSEVAREREEKDIVIQELREEGEKLSKQQLNYSNIIKKLRAKEKESETTIKTQKDKLEEQSRELERLRKQLSAKEEVERRQIDAVCQLNTNNQRLEQLIKDTNAENAELEGKMSVLKTALDTAYKEMAELQRAAATKDAEAQEQALSAEVAARKQIEAALTEAQSQARREQEALMAQVMELQDTLSRAESQANRKERQLRADITELQQRVSEAESRAEELSGAVSAATRPLLRQMENLQSTHATQQSTWENLEATLTRRLNEAQTAAASSIEKERAARDQSSEMGAKAAALQTQVANLQAENTKLSSELEILTSKMNSLAETRSKENTQILALKTSFADEIREVKRERDSLEQQLEIEKTALTAEKKKTSALQEQVKERDRKLIQAASGAGESRTSTPRSSPTPSLSRLSMTGSLNESFSGSQWGDEVFESGWSRGTSLYESMRGNATATVEALTSQLRQREGEVHHLHSEVTRYEAQRESLAQELVSMTRQIETLQTKVQDFERLKAQYTDMEQKYNALLQMHGEKVEEVEELRLDLADVKEMYKAQIDALLRQ